MKKWSIVFMFGVVLLALTSASPAYAQEETSQPAFWGGPGDGSGPLHEYMIEAFAEALGLTPEELESRLSAGETLASVAVSEGVAAEDFSALWLQARQDALDAAVADGVLTADQAAWMLDRMQNGMHGQGGAAGVGRQGGMMRGSRAGAGLGICPWAQE
jgi:hypothetical protein